MKRFAFALSLALTAVATAACGNSSTSATEAKLVVDRTLARIEPLITKDLTPELARTRIGVPDAEPGSGLIIYVYRVDGGRKVWLSFPGFRPIVSARLEEADGTVRELTIR
ncbi:MAG TPA: hypothetical protein VM076_15185 [Gemmatimonadaceae bacterium]|nr:hypothetical protein [Gemmatimonadaceae bacterium]